MIPAPECEQCRLYRNASCRYIQWVMPETDDNTGAADMIPPVPVAQR